MTAAEEEQENQRVQEFRESIPKMCSQLRILTHFYQVRVQTVSRPPQGTCAVVGQTGLTQSTQPPLAAQRRVGTRRRVPRVEDSLRCEQGAH